MISLVIWLLVGFCLVVYARKITELDRRFAKQMLKIVKRYFPGEDLEKMWMRSIEPWPSWAIWIIRIFGIIFAGLSSLILIVELLN